MKQAGTLVIVLATIVATGWPETAASQQMRATTPGALDCRALAGIPNAPLTVEVCEQWIAAQAVLQDALNTPGGERPGDEQLSCAQIIEEMKTLKVAGVSQENAAAGKAAGQDVMAIMQRAQAEAMGLAGAQSARTMAAAATGSNAVAGATATVNAAESKALSDRVGREMAEPRQRMMQANVASMNDLAKSMRENPRFARLMQLTIQRNCTG